MKKVLLIDPWGINSTGEYTKGLIHGLSQLTELTVVTNFYFESNEHAKYTLYKWFFKKTETMKRTKYRSLLRGVEYFKTYSRIIGLLNKQQFDVIHINWLLMYKIDIFFLKRIKRKGVKVIYTAHNVLPHVNGEKYINDMRIIYSLVDRIIVHGEVVKTEFGQLFPQYIDKVYVQKHGFNLQSNTAFQIDSIDQSIIKKVNSFSRVFIFFGNIFFNKGVDILLNFWKTFCRNQNDLLIIAGQKRETYKELDEIEKEIVKYENVLYLNRFIEDNLLNYLIFTSDLILLPYRHASMSGVVFTAADFKKTIVCTAVGAMEEYLKPEEDSLVLKDINEFEEKLHEIISNPSAYDFKKMGENLYRNIHAECEWTVISKKMSEECY